MAIFYRCGKCGKDSGIDKWHKEHGKKARFVCSCGESKNVKYRVVVRALDGKRVCHTVDTRALAEEKHRDLETRKDRKKLFGEVRAPRVDEVFERFLAWAKKEKSSWSDDEYRYAKHLKPVIGGKRLDEVLPSDIGGILQRMRDGIEPYDRPLSDASRRQVRQLANRIFTFAANPEHNPEPWRGANPVKEVGKIVVNNQVTEYLTEDETRRLLGVLKWWRNKQAVMFIRFALYTARRRSEVWNLKWSDIDFENSTMKMKRKPKGGGIAIKHLGPVAMEIIQRSKELSGHPVYVFPNSQGNQMTDNISKVWKRIARRAGIDEVRLHGLRHNAASWAISSGLSLDEVRELLDQDTPSMTMRYAHLLDGAKKRAVREAEAALPVFGVRAEDGGEGD